MGCCCHCSSIFSNLLCRVGQVQVLLGLQKPFLSGVSVPVPSINSSLRVMCLKGWFPTTVAIEVKQLCGYSMERQTKSR